MRALRRPFGSLAILPTAAAALPQRRGSGPIRHATTAIRELPQIVHWPNDGAPFITLPQVYTEDVALPGVMKANVGMYRVQLGGNDYVPDREIGLHVLPGERSQELLTIANHIFGTNRLSLAKYLFICAREDDGLDIHDEAAFLQHVLARVDLTRDLHFQTNTTHHAPPLEREPSVERRVDRLGEPGASLHGVI